MVVSSVVLIILFLASRNNVFQVQNVMSTDLFRGRVINLGIKEKNTACLLFKLEGHIICKLNVVMNDSCSYIHTYIHTYTHTYIHTYIHTYVVVQFYPWCKFYFPLFWGYGYV